MSTQPGEHRAEGHHSGDDCLHGGQLGQRPWERTSVSASYLGGSSHAEHGVLKTEQGKM